MSFCLKFYQNAMKSVNISVGFTFCFSGVQENIEVFLVPWKLYKWIRISSEKKFSCISNFCSNLWSCLAIVSLKWELYLLHWAGGRPLRNRPQTVLSCVLKGCVSPHSRAVPPPARWMASFSGRMSLWTSRRTAGPQLGRTPLNLPSLTTSVWKPHANTQRTP